MSRGNRKRASSPLWDKVVANITDDARYTVNLSNDIVDQIHLYLKQKDWSQKDLAEALGKSPSEISKWMQLGHNFTCRTIGKLSAAFGKDLVVTPLRYESMQGQLMPFGEERNRAYIITKNSNYQTVGSNGMPLASSVEHQTEAVDNLTHAPAQAAIPDRVGTSKPAVNAEWVKQLLSPPTILTEGATVVADNYDETDNPKTSGTPSYAMAA